MPVRECNSGGRPGYKYGDSGKCYTYTPGNTQSRVTARKKAEKQGVAIRVSQIKAGKEPT